jgi:hypothetical protein
MADFGKRGFRADRPESRAVLETHARNFLTGFNHAAASWRDPHAALATVPDEERGFAYEGAGMFAAILDLATAGRTRALARLLDGPGDAYTHLVHVGAGWFFTVARVSVVPMLPSTPLFRWLALDGSGFGEVYFGGLPALYRRARRTPSPKWEARLAGCGRALWFVESADVEGIGAVIRKAAQPAQPHLWAGVGLAAAYAGATDDAGRDRLVAEAGAHLAHLLQGVTFAVGARVRSGIVPAHTERACTQLLGVGAAQAAAWTDETSADLGRTRDVESYMRWKARLRALIAQGGRA